MTTLKARLSDYEFVDFGCSSGGSLERYGRLFQAQGPGLGLDIDAGKVAKTREAGFDAEVVDLTGFRSAEQVRFVVMSHFLEHIENFRDVALITRTACRLGREFVFIRQPWFDSDGYLFRHGLKQFWSHWSGHPNAMTMLQLHCLAESLRETGMIKRFAIFAQGRILDSSHEVIHPLSSAINQHAWDETVHAAKPVLTFDEPVYSETIAVLDINGNSTALIERIFHEADRMYDSAAAV